jgi:alpha-glucosidase
VETLGANAIYMTPIFPAGSIHRYDASSFDRVDRCSAATKPLPRSSRRRTARHPRSATSRRTLRPRHEWFQHASPIRPAPGAVLLRRG